jgi:hypothetical protein
MKIVNLRTVAFQGDVAFERVAKIPELAVRSKDTIVAHSETGHHHVATRAQVFTMPDDGQTLYMRALGKSVDIVHKRPHDTHETLRFLTKPGDVIKIRRQREYTPAGWRRVQD